jgi:hypothetical protein
VDVVHNVLNTIYSIDGYDRAIRVVLRTDHDSAVKVAGRVAAALISGGGSGSMPAREVSNRVYVRTRRLPFVDAQGKSRRMPALSPGEGNSCGRTLEPLRPPPRHASGGQAGLGPQPVGCHSADSEIPAGPWVPWGICAGPPKPGPSHGCRCHWQHRAQNLNFKLKLPRPCRGSSGLGLGRSLVRAEPEGQKRRPGPPGGLVNWPLSGSVDSLSRPTGKSVAKRSSPCPDAPLQTRPFKFKFELPATEWEVMR